MIETIVAYMIGCGDTLPWNFLSPLIFKPDFRPCFRLEIPYSVIDFSEINSFLVFDPTPYTILGGWKIINLFVCA